MSPANRTTALQLLERIQELGPFADFESAEIACNATLWALSEQMLQDERAWFAAALPPELRRLFQSERLPDLAAPVDPEHLFARVALLGGTSLGAAMEHAEVVLRVLAEHVDDDVLKRMHKHFPQLAPLFQVPHWSAAPEHTPRRTGDTPHDLAEGQPGGTRPLYSANPAQTAHRHSVARSDDPHADTRLSSARGLRQEAEGHTLATGAPTVGHPIADSH